MKKILLISSIFITIPGSMYAWLPLYRQRDPFANYSSATLFITALKHIPGDVKNLAKDAAKVAYKKAPTFCTLLKKNSSNLKKITIITLVAGCGYYVLKSKDASSDYDALKSNAECPICNTIPNNNNSLLTTPCCKNNLCRICVVSLRSTYDQTDPNHREYKHCPFCRKDITSIVPVDYPPSTNQS